MRRSLRYSSAALLVVTSLVALGCSEKSTTSTTTTKAGAKTTTTTEPATSSSTTTAGEEQPEQAIWPFASTATRYTDPVEAAKGFATEYLGFVNPAMGDFQQGDSRSGEVPIRARDQGPVTTVMVRQLGSDNSWWVIGAATGNLQIETPKALETVTSPVTVSGQSTAFEGTINLEIREDGRLEPLAEGFTQGGSMGEMGPFSTSLKLSEGSAAGGAIIVKTLSAKDGNIEEASVLRIRFS